jgi:hypothetical protein
MEKTENEHFIDKIVETFKKAAVELEEFQLQAALGKAEAYDKYEEAKKKFNSFVHITKTKVKTGKEKIDEIHTKFDELRVQLALGKAETIDAFNEQKKKILLKIHEIETKIKTNETLNKAYAILLIQIEKFKIQLDLLQKKFEEGKEGVKESFEKGKEDFNVFIKGLKEKFENKSPEKEETRWEHFQDEFSQAFAHMKNAFVK